MAAPRTTLWELDPHTRAKHEILKRYLQAWAAILTQGKFPEVMYVDGFAGPGRYSKGEDGSPVIALHAALKNRDRIRARIRFEFIEEDEERAQVLSEIIDELDVPGNFQIRVIGGETFETAFGKLLDSCKRNGQRLPPTFAFIDPFGWRDVPFSIIRDVMAYPSCEILFNFMYEEINRFLRRRGQEDNFDKFFGTEVWRNGLQIAHSQERNRFLHGLYRQQLRNTAGARYVRSFEMRNQRNRVDYYLFHATNSLLGLKKMKEAMWKVDESGEFKFSDATDPNQSVVFVNEPRFELLKHQLLEHFGGRIATVGEIEEYVLAETAFRETHYRRVLKSLERAEPPVIEVVDPPPGRKCGTYPDRFKSMRLRFRSASS